MTELETVAYLREAGFRSLKEGCHTSAMPTDVDEYNIPVVTLSSAQSAIAERDARTAELEAALDDKEIASGLTHNGSLWRFWSAKAKDVAAKLAAAEARTEAAEALLKEAGPVLALTDIPAFMTEGLEGGRGVVTIRFDDVEGMRSFVDKLRAARSLMSKIGERNGE